MHGPSLLSDLAWILFTGWLAALVCQRIRVPAMLGYIAAGLALSSRFPYWPSLTELDNVQELSELGVVFLMFYIGLEFDLSRLKKAFGPAFLALIAQTLLMVFVGLEASRWLGLSTIDGWFLGGLLSISSSMVSVKLIREAGLSSRPHTGYTIGILILEDMLAILLLVLLSGIAMQGGLDLKAAGRSALLIGAFIVAVFLIGKLGAQRLVKVLYERNNTELITLSTLGLIFGISLFADALQFSWALGGFLAGAILSRSKLAHQIEELTEPLRDLFAAVFFVTVGVIIDPALLWENVGTILLLSALVLVCKFSSCWAGLFLAGIPAREAGRASIIKSQIGEFSFVIIALGAKHGATSPALQSIVSGVAFVTILLTPILIYRESQILNTLGRFSPNAAREFCDLYSRWMRTLALSIERNQFLQFARKPAMRIATHFFLINAIFIAAALVSEHVSVPDFLPVSQSAFQQCVFALSLLLCLPFVVDTMRSINVTVWLFTDSTMSEPTSRHLSKGAYRSAINGLILLLLLLLYGTIFLFVAAPYFPTGAVFLGFLVMAVLVGWIFWKKLVRMHSQWETAVIQAMETEAEDRIARKISTSIKTLNTRKPWPVKVEPTILSARSRWAGVMVKDIDLRKATGAFIAGIERSGFEISDIDASTRVFPHDRILLLGEETQIASAEEYLNQPSEVSAPNSEHFEFSREVVPPLSPWNGMSIGQSQVRTQFQVTIVGMQKGDRRIIGPSPQEQIEVGNLLLLMGPRDRLDAFSQTLATAKEEMPSGNLDEQN